jgi:hypothetical protein
MLKSKERKAQYALTMPFPTEFNLNFKYFLKNEIYAVLSFTDKDDLPLTLDVDYSLTDPGDTGTLTRLITWPGDAIRLTIYRETENTQETDYRNGEDLDREVLEQDLDRAAARDQELKETQNRNISIPITDPAASMMELPAAGARRGHFLACDNTEEANIIPAEGLASVPVTPFMATVLDDLTASAALSTLGVSNMGKTLIAQQDTPSMRYVLGVAPKKGHINLSFSTLGTSKPEIIGTVEVNNAPVDLSGGVPISGSPANNSDNVVYVGPGGNVYFDAVNAPSWSTTKRGYYAGSDRAVAWVRVDSSGLYRYHHFLPTEQCSSIEFEETIEIGPWNMSTGSKNIYHYLSTSSIRNVEISILTDAGFYYPFIFSRAEGGAWIMCGGQFSIVNDYIGLYTGESFSNVNAYFTTSGFTGTSTNRGFIKIKHTVL